ncbi:MAG TPA: M20/M25/M40 family metallo-hydrolase [Pyrinomonadaceae bacterium]|nr:M20/M25/M40 family metallo-hydrolase [Pyrinomonadaceae bacterium]
MQYQKTLRLLFALLLLAPNALAQSMPKPVTPAPDVERLRAHVSYLASEKLEGRRTGTEGAREAARYVAREFMRAGLGPGAGATCGELSEACYMQQFPYVAGVELGKGNALTATRRADAGVPLAVDFRVGEDWMPLGFGSSGTAEGPVAFVGYGITAAEQGHDDYKGAGAAGKVALAFAGTPDGDNPHSRFTRAGGLRFKAAAARAAGAKALVVIAAEEEFKKDRLARLRYDNAGGDAGLPVAVISRQAAAKILGLAGPPLLAEFERSLRGGGGGGPVAVIQDAELGRGVVLNLSTDVVRKNAPAANVVGVLEGSDAKLKSEVIVLGAHYDHLGRGGDGSGSLGREGDIHFGADDNASGTAGLLELARLLASEKEKMRRTVVFVAFGGEEEGLIGSSHYVQNPARPLEQTIMMLNMDMIGRLRNNALSVGGVGTAAELRALVEGVNMVHLPPVVSTGKGGRKQETPAPWVRRFELRLSEDGFGPSDHSSFYARRVPVLFFFTGVHEDYHKPSDTADRVNYEGEAQILGLVRDIVMSLQSRDARPTYAAARAEAGTRTTFRVSLGVMPSYGESTDGLRLDSVREGSPAAAAGVKAGDRVVKLAGRDIRNVYDYTQALSEMKAGQEYEIELVRDGQRLKLKVTPAERK